MKQELVERCRALEQELIREDNLVGESFREAEVEVLDLIHQLDLLHHPGGVPKGYRTTLDELTKAIHTLTLRGRVMRARYEMLKEQVGDDLQDENGADLHKQVESLREEVEELTDYDLAAVAVEREAHESSGGIRDIFKALLMWKDAPEEKLEKEREVAERS